MQDPTVTAPIAVVGAGRVGSALSKRLATCGCHIHGILSRQLSDARELADQVEAPVADEAWEALPSDVRLVLVCVPDEDIGAVAEGLSRVDHLWTETVVAHTSGAYTADALAPLSQRGAAVLSFHPLQTFAPNTPPEAFEGIIIGLEGDDRAVSTGEALARTLGARPVRLSAEGKVRYHSAAALASNGLVALMAVVQEVLATADVESTSAFDFVRPLVEQTWANLEQRPPEEVITGPVARGERKTVEAHLEALVDATPHLVPLYVALSTEMVRVAVRGGQIDRAQAEELLAALQTGLSASANGASSPSPLH